MDWNEFWVYLLQGIIVLAVLFIFYGLAVEVTKTDKKETDK